MQVNLQTAVLVLKSVLNRIATTYNIASGITAFITIIFVRMMEKNGDKNNRNEIISEGCKNKKILIISKKMDQNYFIYICIINEFYINHSVIFTIILCTIHLMMITSIYKTA